MGTLHGLCNVWRILVCIETIFDVLSLFSVKNAQMTSLFNFRMQLLACSKVKCYYTVQFG